MGGLINTGRLRLLLEQMLLLLQCSLGEAGPWGQRAPLLSVE